MPPCCVLPSFYLRICINIQLGAIPLYTIKIVNQGLLQDKALLGCYVGRRGKGTDPGLGPVSVQGRSKSLISFTATEFKARAVKPQSRARESVIVE